MADGTWAAEGGNEGRLAAGAAEGSQQAARGQAAAVRAVWETEQGLVADALETGSSSLIDERSDGLGRKRRG